MLRFLVVTTVLAVIFWLEGIFPLFEGRNNRLRHAVPNLLIAVLNALFTSFFFAAVLVSAVEWASAREFGILRRFGWPYPSETLLAFFLFDLWMYLWHRANHEIPFLWRFHRMHHSDLELDSTSALRFHTGEIILSSLARIVVIPLIGMDLFQLLIYELILQPVIIFHHSNVNLPEKYDRPARSLIVTPNMHRVHHSRLPDETNSNYSSIFSFWDRLLSSFKKRDDTRTLVYGLPYFQEGKWQSFAGLLKTPFARSEETGR